MFKLIFLTLLGLLTVLAIFGEGDGRRVEPARAEPAPAPQVPAAATAIAETATVTPVAVRQTQPRAQRLPGPALRPSPEHGAETPAGVLPAATTDMLYITGNTVNFRSGPSTANEVVGRLSRGQAVTAIGPRDGDWVEIRDDQGRSGFMAAQFLSASRP